MAIKYQEAEDIKKVAEKIVNKLQWNHINLNEVGFLRSFGSGSRGTIARCHALGKAMQLGLKRKGFYLIEVISERFDKMSEEDKVKVIIHELMHIPKTFGGGFIHHHMVNDRTVNKVYEQYKKIDRNSGSENGASFAGGSTLNKASLAGGSARGWF